MQVEEILGDPTSFLEKIFINLKNDGIDIFDYELDHICYRVETLERYDFVKKFLLKQGELLLENEIGGRLIAKIKLKKPIIFKNRKIDLVELPQPKGSDFKEGFEHVEFVISESFEDFMKKYSNLKFKTEGMLKKINSDIVRNYNNCNVKFHHHALEYVVKYLEK